MPSRKRKCSPDPMPGKTKKVAYTREKSQALLAESFHSSAPPQVVDSNNVVINCDHLTASCKRHQQQAATTSSISVEANPAPISRARSS